MQAPQRILTVLAALVAGGCATNDAPESQYDEVARIVGAGLKAPEGGGELGAFADSMALARDELPIGFTRSGSGLIEGRHGAFLHRYFVVCVDATGFAVDPCDATTVRALVLASWAGPLDTATHEGTLQRGGYWTITAPWAATATIAGDTWFAYDAGAYRIEDYRDNLLVLQSDYRVVTAGGMGSTITLTDGAEATPQEIIGDIALTSRIATITLDGVHTTEIDISPVLVR